MICTDFEYENTLERIKLSEEYLRLEREALATRGRTPEQVKRATDPAYCFHLQMQEEADSYERLRRGDFEELRHYRGVGPHLIAMRIFQGLSQRELADKLGIDESKVASNERNEYHGITVNEANRILAALGAELRTNIVVTPHKKANPASGESVLIGS